MNLLDAYQKLKRLEPLFFTKDAAALLDVTSNYAAIILSKLARQKTIVHLARARWAYSDLVDPLLLPNMLAYPMQAYVSLYSALYYRGMIDQIPNTIYAISNGKTKVFETPLATISLHSINSFLFTGYEMIGKSCILMATPEKALFDTLYLQPVKSNLFKKLTELELPENFNFKVFESWLKLVNNKSRKIMISGALEKIIDSNR